MFVTCSHSCTWSFISYNVHLRAWMYRQSAPLYSNSTRLYFMRWNCSKHATEWRCHKQQQQQRHTKKSEKSTPSKYTFDHLALGVHNIFISYFFSTFFLVSSFHSFSCGAVRCVRDGGKKDENGIDRIPYWTSTWMLNMMISSLSYAYFERRSFLTHVFRCATHILMCRIAQRVVWSVEKLSARHKTQM